MKHMNSENGSVIYDSEKKMTDSMQFKQYMKLQIARLSAQKRFGTRNNYKRTLVRLEDFLGKRRLSLRQFDEPFVIAFNDYLEKRGMVRNTVSFYMRILKAVYNRAVSEGIIPQRAPFGHVYTGVDRTMKRSIDMKYIARIKKLDISGKPRLELARDMFLFSFYTRGMPFVDMAFLNRKDIGNGLISYTRHKTQQRLYVQIEPCIREIVDKYWWRSSTFLFPVIRADNQEDAYRQCRSAIGYYNRLLKQLGKLAGLNSPLTSYTSRHTWATSAMNHQVPISVISAAMGHSSEAVTRIYLDSINNSIVDKFNAEILESIDDSDVK